MDREKEERRVNFDLSTFRDRATEREGMSEWTGGWEDGMQFLGVWAVCAELTASLSLT